MIHLMQLSLVISHCNITFSVFWLSQGSVATLIRWGGWSSYCYMCCSFLNLTVKNALKSGVKYNMNSLQASAVADEPAQCGGKHAANK